MAPNRFSKDRKPRDVTPFRDEPPPASIVPMRPTTPGPVHPESPVDTLSDRPITPAPPEWTSYDAPINFTWVIPDELCGMGWPKSRDQVRFLVDQGIDHLVTLSPEKIPPHYAFPNLRHTLIPVEDFTGPTISEIQKFIEITDDARKEGEAVGVHCAEGRGRTGVMCACYLIYYYDMEAWDAIRIMRRQRPGSVERKVQEDTVVRFYTLLVDYGKDSIDRLDQRERQLMEMKRRQQAELIRNDALATQRATMNLMNHMHSFHTKQSAEAKQERINRMRRARSMPKMEDEEDKKVADLKNHLQSFLHGQNKPRRSKSKVRGDKDGESNDCSDSDRKSRATTPGRSLLEEVSLKPASERTIKNQLDAPTNPEQKSEFKNHFRDFMRTPATVKRGRSFSQPRDKDKGSGKEESCLSRKESFNDKYTAEQEQAKIELENHTKSSVGSYGGLLTEDLVKFESQIRKTRKCAVHAYVNKFEIKKKTKTKNHRNDNRTPLIKLKDSKWKVKEEEEEELGEVEEEACREFLVKNICNDFHLTDDRDVCYACQRIYTNVTDNRPLDTLASECMNANDTLDVPWRPHFFGLSGGNDFTLADSLDAEDSIANDILDDGKVVCTLAVPRMTDWAGDYDQTNLTTIDSDKDSGVYSEELSFSFETSVGPDGTEYSSKDDDTISRHHSKSEREVRGNFNEDTSYDKFEGHNVFNELRSPFERKVWKRRNGRYKVRNPMCPPQLYKATINYADQDVTLGSERSAESGLNYEEHFKFLRDIEDIEAGKECNCEIEREKISVNQETSDRDQRRQETLVTAQTIEVNDQQVYHGHLSDFQVKLAQMKLEIAEMVAEAAELDNILGDDEINDVISSHDRHYTMGPEYSDFSCTESNDSETGSEDESEDCLSEYSSPNYMQYHTL